MGTALESANFVVGEKSKLTAKSVWSLFFGSERESVTPPDFMRVLDFGNSGYTQEDARNRLEQSTGVAWI